jgi:hypothetical protein
MERYARRWQTQVHIALSLMFYSTTGELNAVAAKPAAKQADVTACYVANPTDNAMAARGATTMIASLTFPL